MYQIIPTPRLSARIGGVGRVKLNQKLNRGNFTPAETEGAVRAFIDYADRVFGRNFYVTPESGEGIITLEKDESLPKEGYALIASPDGSVKIAAGDVAGLNHGFASLLLSMRNDEDAVSLPIMHICDEPQGAWRGLMVDFACKWPPVSYLCNFIDLCWLYKINILRLHFTDNESCTLPSDVPPTRPTENRHYTKAEIAAILEYAAHRSVTLVPEGSNVTGGQLCVWGDLTIPLPSDPESSREEFVHIRPRLAALAEKTWNPSSDLSEEDFNALYAHTDSVLERMIQR